MSIDTLLFGKHLEDDEHISRIIHKHWLIGVQFLFWPLFSFWISWFVLALAPHRLVLILVTIWSIGSLVWLLRNFFDYYLDAWIITDHGIIDLAWHGWFHRESARILYSDVNGVSYEVVGILGTLMNYGTVSIEKISTGAALSIDHVHQPRAVESLILKNMEAYLHGKNLKDAKRVQEILSEYVALQVQREPFTKKDI